MKRPGWLAVGRVTLAAAMVLPHAAQADFELSGPDGRRILLKDDGTWQYVEAKGQDQAKEKAQATDKEEVKDQDQAKDSPAKDAGEAILRLDRKVGGSASCRYFLTLVNTLPYEIRSLVPQFSAYRSSGVIYDTVFAGFSFLKAGDSQSREIQFRGIPCEEIVRVQVVGGDRCNMGELQKFSESKGECLARLRVVESDVVRFDK